MKHWFFAFAVAVLVASYAAHLERGPSRESTHTQIVEARKALEAATRMLEIHDRIAADLVELEYLDNLSFQFDEDEARAWAIEQVADDRQAIVDMIELQRSSLDRLRRTPR